MPETTLIHKEIANGRWSGDDKVEAANWLKSEMEASGKWRLETRAKRPMRDKVHQRTLQVQQWLAGR